MARPTLQVDALSKCFQIGAAKRANHEALLTQMLGGSANALRRLLRIGRATEPPTVHWALCDINFSVAEGQIVSIIGQNGSGKSTLLKILSRITAPTSGEVRVRGRLASLLEVGTGFHPDLSGRDNVYLNAAILGMKREETRRRFDEIVDFSGVSAFIDTPVQNYSSGMKVRLGFAVAAHIDPDILVIDEVLAVGDAAFQQRCLNRIEEIGASGRTILYVSHQLPTVARLSQRCILLDKGRLVADGPTLETIRLYEKSLGGFSSRLVWDDPGSAPGDDCVRLRMLEITSNGTPVTGPLDVRRPLEIRLSYEVFVAGLPIMPSLHLYDFSGTPVLSSIDVHPEWHGQARDTGVYETVVVIPGNLFNEGNFQLSVAISTMEPFRGHVWVPNALAFWVFDHLEGDSTRGDFGGMLKGYLRPELDWQTVRTSG